MPRFMTDEPNTLKLHDNMSDSEIVFYYKTPTAKEISSYTNGMTRRVRNNVVSRVGENRQEHGLAILTGFRDGDFIIQKNGKNVEISSDPKSPNYEPDWKNVLKKYAADLIAAVAIHVFEETSDRNEGSVGDGNDGADGDRDEEDPNA